MQRGVRRIEALTGNGVLRYINNINAALIGVGTALKVSNPKAVVEGAQKAELTIKSQQKEIEELNAKLASAQLSELFASAQVEKDVTIVSGYVEKVNADVLRKMCQKAIDRDGKCVIVLATNNEGKVTFAAACGKDALAMGANAGKIVKATAQVAGGNGGGKPDMAMAGAKDAGKIDEALKSVKSTVAEMLK